MAMLAIPAAFALAGGAAFAWSTTAIAAGWLIGSWIYSATQDAANQTFDPGAEEMPRINQSLRGATIQTMFGTNRVSPNIVWLNNWTTIRHETSASGGGGKGGGSGGGGKMGGGGSQVSYEYRYDILYHIGMVPEPYNIFGGWLGADRLGYDTVAAIIAGTGNTGGTFDQIGNTSKGSAFLNFDDAFFGSGGPANSSPYYDNWSHYADVTGTPVRWPNTAYVGFQQLSLGSIGQIPQLSFEIGPGKIQIDGNSEFVGVYPNSDGKNGEPRKYSMGTDIYGQDYSIIGGQCIVMSNTGEKIGEFASPLGNFMLVAPIAGGEYILVITTNTTTTINQDFYYYVPVDGGVPVSAVDHVQKQFTVPPFGRFGFYCADSGGNKSPEDFVFILGDTGGDGGSHAIGVIPGVGSLTDMVSGAYTASSPVPIVNLPYRFTIPDGSGSMAEMDNGYFFTLPTKQLVGPFIIEGTKICFYRNKPYMEYHKPGSGNAAICQFARDLYETYPDGMVVAYDHFYNGEYPGEAFSGPEVINNLFEANMPLPDEYEDLFGNAGNANDSYYPQVYTEKFVEDGHIVAFFKLYRDETSSSTWTRMFARIRLMSWNAWLQRFSYMASQAALLYTNDDLGIPPPNPVDGYRDFMLSVFRDKATNAVHVHGFMTSGGSAKNYRYVSRFGTLTIGGGDDVYPPYIVYQILTSPVFGAQFSVSDIDQDSYSAALQYCADEEILVSTTYTRPTPVLSVINDLLALYGGFLTESGGTIRFGVVATSSDPVSNPDGSPRIIDNHHLVVDEPGSPPVTVSRAARQDTFNTVKVNYLDRSLAYRQNIYEVSDEVDVDLTGRRVKEFAPQFVMSEATAAKIADRALWANLYGRDVYDFALGFKDHDLEPGDVVTLVDSFHEDLSLGKRIRIVNWKESKPGRFQVKAVAEIPYFSTGSLPAYNAQQPAPPRGISDEALPPLDFRAYELPKEFNAANGNIFFGYNQAMTTMGARLYLSPDDITYALVKDQTPYIISGAFKDGLPANVDVVQYVHFYLMPGSGSTFAQTHALDDVSQSGRAIGAGVFIAGSEALAVEGLTLMGQNHYRADKVFRGWGGTVVQAHSPGAYFHKHGGGMFTVPINEDKIGTTMFYKIVPYNFQGQGYDISSIEGKSWVVQGTYWRPQLPPRVSAYVDSPVIHSPSSPAIGRTSVVSGGCDVTFKWSDASRLEGFGHGGNGASGYGHFTDDTLDVTYRVEVLSSDMQSVVRCVTVNTGFWTYQREANSSDFGLWSGNFAVKMTPHNSYGDSLRSETCIVELF